MTIFYSVQCKLCGEETQLVSTTAAQVDAWQQGAQHAAIPDLPKDEGKLLFQGICGECSDRMFNGDQRMPNETTTDTPMRTAEEIKTRIARLLALRSESCHSTEMADQIAFQITELQWVLHRMEEAGGGALLPADPYSTWLAPLDVFEHEMEIEKLVSAISDYAYRAVMDKCSRPVQNLVISRVAERLLQSLVLDYKTEVIKLRMFGKKE